MKNLLIAILITTTTSIFAQRQLAELTFDDCQNSDVFQKIRNNTKILKYTTANGSILELNDTLIIGVPSGSITRTTAVGAGETVGIATAKSKTKSSFATIIMGRQLGFGNVILEMDGESTENAKANMQGEVVVISEMKVYHKGSKKKPLALSVLLGEPNGRAFGIYKYMSVADYEKSVLAGEIKPLNAPMTRDEAIAKLKESKELLDLEVIDQAEYDKIKEELTPIIIDK